MGCVASKSDFPLSPRPDTTSGEVSTSVISAGSFWNRRESGESAKTGSGDSGGVENVRLQNICGYIEGEQVVAGWPAWLSKVAKEAIYGWVPLRAESYEKLEKVGEGTYSNVFKARDLDTGKIVALKKVRFDNCEPESVRFMAREIMILRKLNHPNIIKLEGLITARDSRSIYLVFEYMDHDLAGLSSAPDITFTESQVKCLMHQLLSGLEHCHSRGVIHRDIKCANLLVSSEGILKIADFGLANFYNHENRKPMTSRVVTLWYRPPELLFGSNDYEATVDLWSVGCVFAEIYQGKPILQGRTEVEQIHKIFKLCGSPPEEYWKQTKLPRAKLFKPQPQYEKCLKEKLRYLPESALKLLDTLLSIEPHKRGTATSALSSEYFRAKPYACEPSCMPKFSPRKEIDAKPRERSLRRRNSGRENVQASKNKFAVHPHPEEKWNNVFNMKENYENHEMPRKRDDNRLFVDLQLMPSIKLGKDAHLAKQLSQGTKPVSGPLPDSNFSVVVWAKKQKQGYILRPKNTNEVKEQFGEDVEKQMMLKKWIESEENQYDIPHQKSYRTNSSKSFDPLYEEISGPMLQKDKIKFLLAKHERSIRQEVHKSWFQRG